MRWKTRRCALSVGDLDFSWCPGSDLGWYAVVWLLSALPSVIMCVLLATVSQIPLLYSSLGWDEEDGNSSTHSALTPSACFLLKSYLPSTPSCIFTPLFFPSLCYSMTFLFSSPSSFLLSAQPDCNKCAMTESSYQTQIPALPLQPCQFKLYRWRGCSLKPAACRRWKIH